MPHRAVAALLLASTCACAAPDGLRVELQPLSPYVHRFATEAGAGRIDYYFVAPPRRLDARFRAGLREAVEAAARLNADGAALRSIYVYKARNGIGAGFRGTPETLRGRHFNALLSYTRWSGGQLDMFYLMESGRVVFDVLADTPVSPPWEFE
jgi:hypothetical protein